MSLFDLEAVQAQATTFLTEINSLVNKLSNYKKACGPYREDDKIWTVIDISEGTIITEND